MKPFVVNNHDRLVFPANFLGELDFSVIDDLEQFTAIVGRDFEAKAPTGTDILRLIQGRLAGYLAAVPTWRNTALHDHPE
ncbi:hypothetical protein [Pseudonocardia sp. ICBG1142]|uniref:hypothetical protein n=1 Tax=Pseudonocardia sp. ICBG1142 TaxID=2846760 RepID=UPI001CF67698|nr:hypothetical protein [Pseudonocardia sp. ICBG1142]